MLEGLKRDLVYARPATSRRWVAVIVASSLGGMLGLCLSVLWVLDSAFQRALPFPEASRLVIVYEGDGTALSWPTFEAVRAAQTSIELSAAVKVDTLAIPASEAWEATHLRVTPDFFRLFALRSLLGDAPETMPESSLFLAEPLWRRHYGGDVSVIGRSLASEEEHWVLRGVITPTPTYPEGSVLSLLEAPPPDRVAEQIYVVIARLRRGATEAMARAEVEGKARKRVSVIPLRVVLTEGLHKPLQLALFASLIMVLVCVLNLAVFQIVSALARLRDYGTRMMLGATRWSLVRLTVSEHVMMSLAAVFIAVPLAVLVRHHGADVLWFDLPPTTGSNIDGRFALIALAAGAAGLLVMATPPLVVVFVFGRLAIIERWLRSRHRWFFGALLVVQSAGATCLTASALIMTYTFNALTKVDYGFDGSDLVAVPLRVLGPVNQRRLHLDATIERLRQTPGVLQVSGTDSLPLIDTATVARFVSPTTGKAVVARTQSVSPAYFGMMRMTLRAGRECDFLDAERIEPVIVIDNAMADALNVSAPVGTRLERPRGVTATVVGLVNETRSMGPRRPVRPVVYQCQPRQGIETATVLIKPLRSVSEFLQRPDLLRSSGFVVIRDVKPFSQVRSEVVARDRRRFVAYNIFAVASLVLVGIAI